MCDVRALSWYFQCHSGHYYLCIDVSKQLQLYINNAMPTEQIHLNVVEAHNFQ